MNHSNFIGMDLTTILQKLPALHRNFETGVTKPYSFRKEQLKKLKASILKHEKELYDALLGDLKKSPEETWVTEIGMVVAELNAAISQLRYWMLPEPVPTNLLNLPSSSKVIREPLGVVFIVAPWNYPLQLLFNPLIGAIAAGNCVVLKASEHAPATDEIMKKIIQSAFPDNYILYVQGEGQELIPPMIEQSDFDHLFYTGSTAVGRLIYKMAADKLIPVTLELGGKSPCVVEQDADMKSSARRITMTKFSNAGQMCVAPDYILVHASKTDAFIGEMKKWIEKFFSGKPEESYNYGKIINKGQFSRLKKYLSEGRIVHGGRHDEAKLFMEPTILMDIQPGAAVMKDEIFGPVLPVIPFHNQEEAMKIISQSPNPLSFYIYTSSNAREKQWIDTVQAGGVCVNNSSWHLTNHHLPFGGRGFSGTGNYHGRYSFETFSHRKAVMKTPSWFDPDIKYPPMKGKLRLYKWVVR